MVSRILTRKIYRDLFHRKLSLMAILTIMAIGISCYAGFKSVYLDLDRARQTYYNEYRLGDFTVELKRAPHWTLDQVREIPNIRNAEARISLSVRILLTGQEEPILGQAISVPFFRRPILNDLLLRSGMWFSNPTANEVILNESFAKANQIQLGDTLRVLFLDQEYALLVVGMAMSPEFVYLISPSGGLAPDPARFGVLYFPERFLQEVSNLVGAYNQVVGQIHEHAPTRILQMFEEIEEKLDPYGVLNTTPYYDQPSIRFLADELDGLKTSSTIMPFIFLSVATLILNVLLGRLVTQQRTIIGTLKALGYGNIRISFHYLSYGFFLGILSGLFGAIAGYGIQVGMLSLYKQFYALPAIPAHFYLPIYIQTIFLSCVFASAGTLKGVYQAFHLTPAEAMRPRMPERVGRILLERIPFLWSRLPFEMKLICRTIFRNPMRSLVNILASFVSTALILACLCNYDALFYLMNHEFRKISHEDIQVSLRDPTDLNAVTEISALPFIARVESEMNIACDISNGSKKKRIGISGLPREHQFHTPLLQDGTPIQLPETGLVLSEKLAEILGVRPGDVLRLRPLIGRRQVTFIPVVAVVKSYLGLSAYADQTYLSRLIGEEAVANLLRCKIHTFQAPSILLKNLHPRPEVMGITDRERVFVQMDKTFGETMSLMIGILVLFSGSIAFGSVLNSTLVSLSEREREVSTLRVLGYTPIQITRIFSGESFFLNLVGVIFGLYGGILLNQLIALQYSTELYRFPAVWNPSRLLHSILLMVAFVSLAQILVYQILRRIPWLDALKIKE